MPKITTESAFTVHLADGSPFNVPVGESEVPDEVAEHWFTKGHLVGTPRGRMPVVEGADGLMIEADEAGQRTTAPRMLDDPMREQTRQEGPLDWSEKNPRAVEAAAKRAEEAGSNPPEPVEVKAAAQTPKPPRALPMPPPPPEPNT